MSKLCRGFLAPSIAALLTACLPSPERLESVAPDAPVEAARSFLSNLAEGNVATIKPDLHPDLDAPDVLEGLAPLFAASSESSSFDVQFGSWQWVYISGEGQHELAYEVAIDEKFVAVSLAFKERANSLLISGVRYQELKGSLIEFNRFTLSKKGTTHYFFLVVGLAIPLFCLSCVFVCWRRRPRRRWLWTLFILFAWPILSLNWSTGALSLQILGFNLFGAAFSQTGPLHPVIFQLGFPIGAIIFLITKPTSRADSEPCLAPDDPAA